MNFIKGNKSAIAEENNNQPTRSSQFGFAPDMPNLFKGIVPITYTTSKPGPVTLRVFNSSGQLIKTLVNNRFEPAGTRTISWTPQDDTHRSISNGIYFLRIESQSETATHKIMIVK